MEKIAEQVQKISVLLPFIDEEKKYLTPKTKFLYVEDGSVDVDELASDLYMTNPEIKIVVYRQGSTIPVLSDKGVSNGR